MEIAHYFDMGKYGPYVWSCYGLTALTLIANIWSATRAHRLEYQRTWRRLQHNPRSED